MTRAGIDRLAAFLAEAVSVPGLDGYRPGEPLAPDVERRLEVIYRRHFGDAAVPGPRAGQ